MELLILLSIFKTVEFYVIVAVIAAFVVALAALPERKGEVKTYMLAGDLVASVDDSASDDSGPGHGSIRFECHEGNIVTLRRDGLQGVALNGAVSIVVSVSRFDVTIEERITPGAHPSFGDASAAIFYLDFLAPEWYHIRYESDRHSEHAALTLHVRPGIVVTKPLIH